VIRVNVPALMKQVADGGAVFGSGGEWEVFITSLRAHAGS